MTINEIALEHYLILSSLLFSIGVTGLFMNRKNVITILMSVELMLLAVNLNFVAFSVHLQDIVGQIFSLIILSIAAAEVSIGLAILVLYSRNRGSIEIEDINQMKG
jgi:NADH-quinone oxidoreductase subunit K